MKRTYIDFSKTNMFSKKFNDFISEHKEKTYYPSYENILRVSDQIKFPPEKRKDLRNVLLKQYSEIDLSEPVKKNIECLIDDNTFAVTTGHQLNIFSGPLYIIYKIISTIKLSENLNAKYPNKNFIPVYWMASEDHDFLEIKSFFSNGKKYNWDIEAKGAVGNIDPRSLKKLINLIPDSLDIFDMAYTSSVTLSDAVRKYMNSIFGNYGLVVIDPSSKILKEKIHDLIIDDIFNNTISKVEKSSVQKSEVYVRKINFFYMNNGIRERIESNNDKYKVVGTDIEFTKSDLRKLIDSNPEYFSPNVITRCLYQQRIMPNVAYIGGPSEVLYWLTFRKFFETYNEVFPVIIPRDSVLIIPSKSSSIIKKYRLDKEDIFNGKNYMERKALGVLNDKDKNFSLEISTIKDQFKLIAEKYKLVDKTMSPHVLANSKKIEKMLSQIEKRFFKSQKERNTVLVSKINDLNNSAFPEGVPQERKENILTFYSSTLIKDLYRLLDPMQLKFKIVE